MTKSDLRRELQQKRKALHPTAQATSANRLLLQIRHLPCYKRAKNVGFFFARGGELSPEMVLQVALRQSKRCYLPCLTSKKTLVFRLYQDSTKLIVNRFNIPEPSPSCKKIAIDKLDVVLVPLVAFDRDGNRLGMGGGFYDRTFNFKRHQCRRNPLLVGIAHSFQEVSSLKTEPWDVPLNYIVTEKARIVPRYKRRIF